MEDEKKLESADAGSSNTNVDPVLKAGESAPDQASLKKTNEGLEVKLGTQGKELGEYREYFKSISPLLEKLNEQPGLSQGIIDGKITPEMVKAISEGKVKIEDATKISEAHDKIKKDLGKVEYKKMDSEQIEKLVSDKVEIESKKMQGEIDKKEVKRNFFQHFDDFVSKAKDFQEYGVDINKWCDEHPKIDDIEIAYEVVKGRRLHEKVKKEQELASGNVAKNIAANAAGGSSQTTAIASDKDVFDKFISNRRNPNIF